MIIIKIISQENINSFLYSGYFYDSIYEYKDFMKDYTFNETYNNFSMEEIVPYGKEVLLKTIEKTFDTNKKHILPLSGGLDSRLILGLLLEFTEAKNIQTYTYGTPKTLDYDIGLEVAKKVGTNHTQLDLRMQKYEIDALMDMSNLINNQTFLFHHPPVEFIKGLDTDAQIWSGFLGEHSGGALSSFKQSMRKSKKTFLEKTQFNHSLEFNRAERKKMVNLIPNYEAYPNLSNYEVIDILFRQRRLTAPHTMFEGLNYNTPFIEKEWLDFAFSINRKYRENGYFYEKIMKDSFPELFNLRAKNFGGLTINSSRINVIRKKVQNRFQAKINKKINLISNPLINYVDFAKEIRNNKSLQNVIRETISDFQKRDLLNTTIEDKFKQHLNKQRDYTELLLIIASLEINFKAMEAKGYII